MPAYGLEDHPFSKFEPFKTDASLISNGAAMRKYQRSHHVDRLSPQFLVYSPRSAYYSNIVTNEPFAAGADALIAPPHVQRTAVFYHGYFVQFTLQRRARVHVLLNIRGSVERLLGKTAADFDTPAEWGNPEPTFVKMDGSSTSALNPGISRMTHSHKPQFPKYAVAFEVPVPDDLTVTLPTPYEVKLPGHETWNTFIVLITQPDTDALTAFPAPSLPAPFAAFHPTAAEGTIVNPAENIPVPNDYCPDWVHDLYVVKSDTGGEDIGEPAYWRTWHPLIDPVYWCYFDHEHGAFPGKNYSPKFGYTAWKTPDDSTEHGRQNESHNGFKIYAFRVKDGRSVIITMHSHVALPRRFSARKHTLIFAVVGADGSLQAELHMKADFGAMFGQLSGVPFRNGRVPVGPGQDDIWEETNGFHTHIGRRMNIINTNTDNYPAGLNRTWLLGRIPPYASHVGGIYELWTCNLNQCANRYIRNLRFDIENPSNAVCDAELPLDANNMCTLKGDSMKRTIFTPGFTVGSTYCSFGADVSGEFYTDSYMGSLLPGKGKEAARQFFVDGFVPVEIPRGHMKMVDFWSGHFVFQEYDPAAKVRVWNIDGAVDKTVN